LEQVCRIVEKMTAREELARKLTDFGVGRYFKVNKSLGLTDWTDLLDVIEEWHQKHSARRE